MKRDPRINTKTVGWKQYVFALLIIVLIVGAYTAIFFYFSGDVSHERVYGMSLSLFGFVLFISFLFLVLFAIVRRRFISRPTRHISEGARKVAEGDYTVRLEPLRKDGKKDEFEVLFEDFNTMVEELQSTEMLKKDFVSNVSHEFKTPLSVIQNYATMLQSENLPEEKRIQYAETVTEATERLTTLVTNILQMSRLENQKIHPKPIPYNLSEQLSRCILGFEQIMDDKNIDLSVELDQNIILTADEDLLDIVWNNLLSNAFKFSSQDGSVSVIAKQDDTTITVSVEDHGCGIDEKSLMHIFDKFYQADTSHAVKGNGLGLSLVKNIVELSGGSISVASTPGIGTTFTVQYHRQPV